MRFLSSVWLGGSGEITVRSPCLGYRAVLSRGAMKGLALAHDSVAHPAVFFLSDSLLFSQKRPVPMGHYVPAQAQLAVLCCCPLCRGLRKGPGIAVRQEGSSPSVPLFGYANPVNHLPQVARAGLPQLPVLLWVRPLECQRKEWKGKSWVAGLAVK